MAMATMHDLLYAELTDLYGAETRLASALPVLVDRAVATEVRKACQDRLERTHEHIARLEQIFRAIESDPCASACREMDDLVAPRPLREDANTERGLHDAEIMVTTERVRQFLAGAYGSTLAFATLLGHTDAARLLARTHAEERALDARVPASTRVDATAATPHRAAARRSLWKPAIVAGAKLAMSARR